MPPIKALLVEDDIYYPAMGDLLDGQMFQALPQVVAAQAYIGCSIGQAALFLEGFNDEVEKAVIRCRICGNVERSKCEHVVLLVAEQRVVSADSEMRTFSDRRKSETP